MSRACRQPVCLLAVHVWVDLGGEPGSGRKVVGTGVQQKLPPGRQISYLSKGGTRRTRLIGLPAIWMRLKRQGGRRLICGWVGQGACVPCRIGERNNALRAVHQASRRDTARRVV